MVSMWCSILYVDPVSLRVQCLMSGLETGDYTLDVVINYSGPSSPLLSPGPLEAAGAGRISK